MNSYYAQGAVAYAESRRQDLVAEAEHQAMLAEASRGARRDRSFAAPARLRRAVGALLVRAGQRLQDAQRPRVEDAPAAIASLRCAR